MIRALIPILLFFMLLLPTALLNAATADETSADVREVRSDAPVTIFNRTVAVFRAPFLGVTAADRAKRAEEVLGQILSKGGQGVVRLQQVPQGYAIMLDGILAFFVVPEDSDPLKQESLQETAQKSVTALEQVVRETLEARNLATMLHATALALAATALLLLTGWLLQRSRTWLGNRLTRLANTYSEKLSVGGESLLNRERIIILISRTVSLIHWPIIALLLFNWIGFVLSRFPYTRPWGEQMNQYLLNLVKNLGSTVINAIPGMLVALLIFFIAKLLTSLIKTAFDRIEQGKFEFAGLDRDTIRPTRRLIAAAIWLFALAMAYPYLPGAQTAAFKGLSVLVGLMVSLGGSSLVGQAASGLMLMYTRTLRTGEYVQIAATEGTVMELGLFATRIRTGLGEELSLPNALIMANITRNYSRTVQGPGYILDASVSIGYDTPWRQVHAMLVEAAQRTGGVLSDPPPQVFQTALSDFYPQYRLVCQAIPSQPSTRAEAMNALHANIQDVFNEYGVQIMSPHYLGDPAHPKWVPKEKWYPPPVRQDG